MENVANLENKVLNYFSSIYASENCCVQNDIISKTVPPLVTIKDNGFLTNIPTKSDVHSAVFGVNGDGVPGPNGFWWVLINHFGKLLMMMCLNRFFNFSIWLVVAKSEFEA